MRSKLVTASKDDLVRLIERLAADSAEVSARLDYLTDPDAAAKALQGRIRSVRSSKSFVSYGEAREVAAEIGVIAADIRADVLLKDPLKAAALAEKLFSLDDVIFNRADDSDGVIGEELRAACVLWLDAAAAAREANAGADADWVAALYELYQANDYGVREPLLEEARRGAYALLGDRPRQIEVRRELYRRAPGIHTYRALEELLPAAERSALRTRACLDMKSNPHVATAAELLFELQEPCLAEQLIVDRASELDGRNYVLLTSLVETARANGRWLAATMIWRALLDAILTRGYSKAYGHAARYLRELRGTASQIEDFHGHPTHADYERSLRIAHGRKASFWQRLSDA